MKFELDNVSWSIKRLGYKLWDKRADIAFYSGMMGSALGTFLFVKASKKNQPVIEKYKEKKKEIDGMTDLPKEEKDKLTKENTVEVIKGSVKNYALPVAVTATSYAAQTYSHVKISSDLTKANAFITASVAAMEALKQRIIESEGEDRWRELMYGQTANKVVEVDPETGEIKESVEYNLGSGTYDFSFPFNAEVCDSESQYDTYKGINYKTLSLICNCWNDKLKRLKKVIMLSSVWESIYGNLNKFPEEWLKAGWVPSKGTEPMTDISFGLDANDAATVAFRNGETPDVRLVFNCVPNVYDVI